MTRRTYTKDWPESYYPSYGPNGVINTDENGLGMITRSNMHVEERYGLPVPWRANWDVFNECCCRVCCGCRPIDGEAKPWPDGIAESIILRITTECEMYWSSDGQPHNCDYSIFQAFFDQEWEIQRESDIQPCTWYRIVDIPPMHTGDYCGTGECTVFPNGGKMLLLARFVAYCGAGEGYTAWPYSAHCCAFEVQVNLWNNDAGSPPANYELWNRWIYAAMAPSGVSGVGECSYSEDPRCFQMGLGMDCLEGAMSLWYQGSNPPYGFTWSCCDDLVDGPFWDCRLKMADIEIEMIPPELEA